MTARLDEKEMQRCWKLQVDAGIDGIIVCGSLGEASTLDAAEKIESVKIAKKISGKLPVLLTSLGWLDAQCLPHGGSRGQGGRGGLHGAAGSAL